MSCSLHPQWVHSSEDCPLCLPTKEWQTGKPPHKVVVEVEYEDKIVQARAIWGDPDAGVLPHWELFDGNILIGPSAFTRWRHL